MDNLFDLINLLIYIISSIYWRIGIAFTVFVVISLFAYLLSKIPVPLRWGVSIGTIVFLVLSAISYLLNLPLDPPLPRALPPDYVSLWVKVALVFGSIQVSQLLVLVALYFKKR